MVHSLKRCEIEQGANEEISGVGQKKKTEETVWQLTLAKQF